MPKVVRNTGWILLISCALIVWQSGRAVTAQVVPTTCATVQYLMDERVTPYEFEIGGGVLADGVPVTQPITNAYYADTWSLNAQLPRNAGDFIIPSTISIRVDNITNDDLQQLISLELAVFYGMEQITAYEPISANNTYAYTVDRDGAYTIVIRRTDVSVQGSGRYTFAPFFNEGPPLTVSDIRDETTTGALATPPILTDDGHTRIPFEAADVLLHPGSVASAASREGTGAQVFFIPAESQSGVLVNSWADEVALIGGDLSVVGSFDGRVRRLYFQNYGYLSALTDGNLNTIIDSNGVEIGLTWDAIEGLWLANNCVGFRLSDGRQFIAPMQLGNRSINLRGTVDDFAMRVVTPNTEGGAVSHNIALDWAGIAAGSTTTLVDGTFSALLDGDRRIDLQSRQIDFRRRADLADENAPSEHIPLAVTLADRETELLVDFVNLGRLSLVGDDLTLTFTDATRSVRPRTITDVDFERIEALQDVIRIVERGTETQAGREHLLLGEDEGYIEIVTPAGVPSSDPTVLAGNLNYTPRGLNNLGAECYPVNTALPQANCPPNGHPNPVNLNVWYGVTDALAHGGLIDLALTRHFNTADHQVGGPFGPGWNTTFRLDYAVEFDEGRNSRPVTQQTVAAYPVGLDLIWAPRGIVTYIAPSGSRHVFQSPQAAYDTGEMRAITMPGWTLTRTDVRSERWVLQQEDGLEYRFDRAGRLREYGYPTRGQLIDIQYPADNLNGTRDLTPAIPVVISDVNTMRRLELYFDGDRIVRSALRDMTVPESPLAVDLNQCLVTESCFETRYTYDETGRLSTVNYADGTAATYSYDNLGRLISHDDPRAPIADRMTYAYDEGLTITLTDADQVWYRLSPAVVDEIADTLSRDVTGPTGDDRTYTYDLTSTALKTAGTTYTLLSETSPFADQSDFEALPITYIWQNGILQAIDERILGLGEDRSGRVTGQLIYGDLSTYHPERFGVAFPDFRAEYLSVIGPGGQTRIVPDALIFADGRIRDFEYDAAGRVATRIDRYGDQTRGTFSYKWDASNRLRSLTNEDDNTVIQYEYNGLGLVRTVSQYRVNDPQAAWYTISLIYDGLGRPITAIANVDADTALIYQISYTTDTAAHTTTQTITDSTGTVTESVYNAQGHLLASTVRPADGSVQYLRRTVYSYDAMRRLSASTAFLLPLDDAGAETSVTTTYDYINVPTLDDGTPNFGHAMVITDPLGRTTRYTFDALDRIREVVDIFGQRTRYDYTVNGLGLRIRERKLFAGQQLGQTDYLFETRWQLQDVIRTIGPLTEEDAQEIQTWEINFDGLTTRLSELVSGRQRQDWLVYIGRPTTVNLSRDPIIRDAVGASPNPNISADYDFKGRPLTVTRRVSAAADGDAQSLMYAVRYCPQTFGAETTLYFGPDVSADQVNCGSEAYERAVTVNAHEQITRVEDVNGDRTYAYNPVVGGWQVIMTTDDGATWNLTYDGIGQLTGWRDHNGIMRQYTYDSLGQLRDVMTTLPGGTAQPEASFAFDYNVLGQVTRAVDQLGRGRGNIYVYDDLGRLTVQQDVRTTNATIYGYNADDTLSTIISPLGNTTTLLYEDIDDPRRLTGIIDPTGNALNFTWNDANNTVTFTDGRGNRMRYLFDRYGALWRIEELNTVGETVRQHVLRYDATGQVTAWDQNIPLDLESNAGPALALNILRESNTLTVSGSEDVSWSRRFTLIDPAQISAVDGEAQATSSYSYDALGRLTQITVPGQRWQFAYDLGEPRLTYTPPNGEAHTLSMDALHRLVDETLGDTVLAALSYRRGGVADVDVLVESPLGDYVVTYATGDNASRPTAIVLRGPGQRVTYVYNEESLLSEITTEACIVSLPDTDEPVDNGGVATVDPADPDAAFRPDICLDTGDDQPAWRTTQRVLYDPLGRPVRRIDEEQNIETFAYDDAGNLITYQNANGKTFSYSYGELNQLRHITGPTGIRVLLAYDSRDRVAGLCRTRAENAATYNECAAQPLNVLETYTYDSLGRLASTAFPNPEGDAENAITYAYDVANGGALSGWSLPDDRTINVSRGNAFNQVDRFSIGGVTYVPSLTNGRLSGIASTALARDYTYDVFGRLESITVDGRTIQYAYFGDTLGYTISDASSGTQIVFGLDEAGFLSQIDVPQFVGDNRIEYRDNQDDRLLTALIPYRPLTDGRSRIEVQTNRRGDTESVAYVQEDLFIDYVLDGDGQVQRQSINGAEGYFIETANGYVVVVGYDNDDRPLTIRVSDRDSGELIYLLRYTYDSLGRRTSEVRQFGTGDQVNLAYEYDGSRLVRRIITLNINEPEAANMDGGPLLALLSWLMWALRSPRRRRLVLASVVGAVGVGVVLTLVTAQPTQAGIIHEYTYDVAGNVTEVQARLPDAEEPQTCATYTYDAANRLTTVSVADGQLTRNYNYDLYNRLVGVDESMLVYQGSSNLLLARSEGETGVNFYGNTTGLSSYLLTQGDAVSWLLTDGHQHILGDNSGEGESPVWLFDPLGRFLPLTPPPADDPCFFGRLPASLRGLDVLQLQDQLIWDTDVNLYFGEGRVYDPEIGIYLQRDPLGPDVYGSVYAFPNRPTSPPVREREPAYAEGLLRLRGAVDNIAGVNALTAANIADSMQPTPPLQSIAPLPLMLDAISERTQVQVQAQLDLPLWLMTNYNLPAAYVDAHGALRLPIDSAPGQGGLNTPIIPTELDWQLADDWVPVIGSPLSQLTDMQTLAIPNETHFSIYESLAWLPDYSDYRVAYADPHPPPPATPSAAMHHLPQTLRNPAAAADALDVIAMLLALPGRTGEAWIDGALTTALPGLPIMPPQTLDDYLTRWFSTDTLGVAEQLNARWPELPSIEVPTFELGYNRNWVPLSHWADR